jgi:hypothetical protein
MTARPTRVLLITDHPRAETRVLAAVHDRAARGPVQLRVLSPNPARAEVHLRHPERHDQVAEAERVLHTCLPDFQQAAGGPVTGSVSIRHDPYDAVEETLLAEPVDEFLVAVSAGGLSRALHLDLPHRLSHFGLPVQVVAPAVVAATS